MYVSSCSLLQWTCVLDTHKWCLFLFLCFFFCQLQVVVQLPEREAETGERQVCHRSNIRGGEQLSWESTCVYAQGKVDISCIFMFIWRQHCVTKLLIWWLHIHCLLRCRGYGSTTVSSWCLNAKLHGADGHSIGRYERCPLPSILASGPCIFALAVTYLSQKQLFVFSVVT